jgi:Ca2+-transporting ATPase
MNATPAERLDAVEPDEPPWHALSVAEVSARLGSDPVRGLDPEEARRRLERDGPNALAETRSRPAWRIFVDQFRSLVVGLLIAAAALALVMNEPLETAAIGVVILLNALIGFLTEWRADQAIEALRRQAVPEAHVVRGGAESVIPAGDLVAGDVVLLTTGGRVPADGRVVEGQRLQVVEAALTGESQPVEKQVEPVADPRAALGDRVSMAFLGTAVSEGRGRLLVTATGPRSEMGKIGTLLGTAEDQETPLERKLARLGRSLVWLVLALCGVITLAGLARGLPLLHMIETGISLAIAAVPEGLPAVATMTLALGMQRMARMRALVRRLPAVETLGSTTVICTDKTGTLTRNEIAAQALVLPLDRAIAVDGDLRARKEADLALNLALRVAALCNDARLDQRDGGHTIVGDPTEGALLMAAVAGGLDLAALRRDHPRLGEIPFDSRAMRMVTTHREPDGRVVAYVKGAPAAVLERSATALVDGSARPLDEAGRAAIRAANEALASRALRVLALARRELGDGEDPSHPRDDGLTFLGLAGLADPVREEAREAIETCRAAGIRVIMITGDQVATAREIARQLGLDRDPSGRPMRTVHAGELDGLDAAGWEAVGGEASVFARVTPEHKLRIVEALQRRGQIVAMTGDGVNDAPALKTADIGVAMGIMGTEVAKEAADMIITDDNFATIVKAVEQGRIIYANILKFIHFLFSCNFAEILAVFAAILVGWPLPLVPLQILWLNLVTDVFPALALAVEPAAPYTMRRPPRDPNEQLLGRRFLGLLFWQGMLLAMLTLAAFGIGLGWYGDDEPGLARARTMAFMTLALSQIFHAFNARSRTQSAFAPRTIFANPWIWAAAVLCFGLQTLVVAVPLLRDVLGTVPPSLGDFAVVTACAAAPLVVVEARKWFWRRSHRDAVEAAGGQRLRGVAG